MDRPWSQMDSLIVRPVRCEERARWRELLDAHHYLGFRPIIGESIWYVATAGDPWVALLGWGAAALKCTARDHWIGWTPALKLRRLHLIANNARFLILPAWHYPNFASRILSLNLKRLSQDWERYYGHPILLAETFVDAARFPGTCYRAAGWQALGTTRGFAKRGTRYVAQGQPKIFLIRPLHPEALPALRRLGLGGPALLAPFLPPCSSQRKEHLLMVDVNRLPLEGEGGLIDLLRTLVDPRKPRGVRPSPGDGGCHCRRCSAHPRRHGALHRRIQKGRLPVYRQGPSTHPAPRHRRSQLQSVSPRSTPRPIKRMAVWKSATSGPAPS